MTRVLESFAQTDVGLYRQNNEDACLILEDCGFYVLADGMGGHASGEVASRLTIETTHRLIQSAIEHPNGQSYSQTLVNAIETANAVVFHEANKDEALRGMGTTVVALLQEAKAIWVAHVGDSRCYRMRNGVLELLTEDHSLRNFYVREYGYTPEEAALVAESNVILRAVGLRETTVVDVSCHTLQSGDLFLLCSDGLSDYVEEPQILEILLQYTSLSDIASALIQMANAMGGYDNTTVLLARVQLDDDTK
jgi:serine/threonine protein phosphatase PrpC